MIMIIRWCWRRWLWLYQRWWRRRWFITTIAATMMTLALVAVAIFITTRIILPLLVSHGDQLNIFVIHGVFFFSFTLSLYLLRLFVASYYMSSPSFVCFIRPFDRVQNLSHCGWDYVYYCVCIVFIVVAGLFAKYGYSLSSLVSL